MNKSKMFFLLRCFLAGFFWRDFFGGSSLKTARPRSTKISTRLEIETLSSFSFSLSLSLSLLLSHTLSASLSIAQTHTRPLSRGGLCDPCHLNTHINVNQRFFSYFSTSLDSFQFPHHLSISLSLSNKQAHTLTRTPTLTRTCALTHSPHMLSLGPFILNEKKLKDLLS